MLGATRTQTFSSCLRIIVYLTEIDLNQVALIDFFLHEYVSLFSFRHEFLSCQKPEQIDF